MLQRKKRAMATESLLERIFGVIYFVTWSATFYPQITLVFRRKNSGGLSTDFMIINVTGFISYSIFTFSSFYSSKAAEAYIQRTGYAPQVVQSDILFAAHGAIMCTVLICQLFYYPPRTPPKPANLFVTSVIFGFVIAGLIACLLDMFDWYVYLRFAGNVKVLASLVKHFPQVWLNRARESTVGWSYTMVLFDVIGGLFSVGQQALRSFRMGSLAPFTSNYAKTFLAVESLAFDFFFIAQHMMWYTDRHDPELDGPKGITSKQQVGVDAPPPTEDAPLV